MPIPYLFRALMDVGRRALPVNARTMVDTALGDRSPITEKNFSVEELAAMRSAVTQAELARARELHSLEKVYEAYTGMDPVSEGRITYDRNNPTGELLINPSKTKTAGELAAQTSSQMAKERAAPVSVQYHHYPVDAESKIDSIGWADTAAQSVNNPSYRMATTVGRALAKRDPAGNLVVEDEYSFHGGAFGAVNVPTMVLDSVMSKIVPKGEGRPVKINLGAKMPPARKEKE